MMGDPMHTPTTTAIVLAAGKGTRMQAADGAALDEAAQAMAARGLKALVPVAGRPVLAHHFARLAEAGFGHVVLVVNPTQDALRDAAAPLAVQAGLQLSFAVQAEPRGTADAVAAACDCVNGSALVLNGDNLYPVEALRDVAACPVAALAGFSLSALEAGGIDPERARAFSVLQADADGWLQRIVEKPSEAEWDAMGSDSLVGMNLWRLTPPLFEVCGREGDSPRGERELPLAVMRAVRGGQRVRVLRCEAPILDLTRQADIPRADRWLRDHT